ncbi:hypothetical protein AMECASPLE_025704 [Ameca splendens]|uniref:Uncharacterized protein n=1 Tax=Ameca splendens TaxID=208324 RepID=A0ABV0YFU0_9TELE
MKSKLDHNAENNNFFVQKKRRKLKMKSYASENGLSPPRPPPSSTPKYREEFKTTFTRWVSIKLLPAEAWTMPSPERCHSKGLEDGTKQQTEVVLMLCNLDKEK